MQCDTHPQVETFTSCNKCDKAICYRCMVQTPVGFRCPECAQVRKLPAFTLTTLETLQALGAAIALTVAAGVGWAVIERVGFLFIIVAAGFGLGYAISEGLSYATNRKRAPSLQVMAGAIAIVSYFLGNVFLYLFFTDFGLSVALDHTFDITLFRFLSAIIAGSFAVSRLRQL